MPACRFPPPSAMAAPFSPNRQSAACGGKVLDVSGAGTGNGALVQQWHWLGSDNQKWWIARA